MLAMAQRPSSVPSRAVPVPFKSSRRVILFLALIIYPFYNVTSSEEEIADTGSRQRQKCEPLAPGADNASTLVIRHNHNRKLAGCQEVLVRYCLYAGDSLDVDQVETAEDAI